MATAKFRFDPAPLRRLREQRQLTTTTFGRRLKRPMTGVQITEIEAVKRYPRVDTLLRLCEDLQLDPRKFFVPTNGGRKRR